MTDYVTDLIEMWNGGMTEEQFDKKYPPKPTEKQIKKIHFEAYHDVVEYTDGTTEWVAIGD